MALGLQVEPWAYELAPSRPSPNCGYTCLRIPSPQQDAVGMLVAMVKNRDWLKWADQEVHQVSGFSCQKIEV